MITHITKYVVKPEYTHQFKYALIANSNGIKQTPGHLDSKIFVDNQLSNVFFSFQRWQNQAAVDLYRTQPYKHNLICYCETMLAQPIEKYDLTDIGPEPINDLQQASDKDDVFTIFFIFKITPEYKHQLLQQFEHHIEQTRREEGCLLFDLYGVQDCDDTMVVYEQWRSESAVWDIHFKQPYAVETGKLMHQAVVGDLEQFMNFVSEVH